LNAAGANARLGSGDFLVAEADESDASFLFLSPVISVVTNIDADHMETYGHDFERLKGAFVDFLNRLPFYGVAVLCGDDPNVRAIMPQVPKQIITYGLNDSCNFYAENIVAADGQMRFDCVRVNGSVSRLPITLNLPGLHNVLNALAAIAVATEVQISDAAIIKALAEFKGVDRRFQRYGEVALQNSDGTAAAASRWSTTTAITRSKWRQRWPLPAAPSLAAAGTGLPAASLHADPRLF
jgi:UDP-N-acetylmuramate--alanine ligase